MKLLYLITFIFCAVNCSQKSDKNKTIVAAKAVDPNYHRIDSFGSVYGDTSKFKALACGLYTNENGTMGYKTADYSFTDSINRKPFDMYLISIYAADLNDTINRGSKEMKYVVDTATFKILSSYYFKDKKHVYNFNPMDDGGTIAINWDIDLKTFRILESDVYAKDKKHCYYRGRIIEGADLNSFKVLDTSYSRWIAYDKKNYYDMENKMNAADIKKQNLDSIRRKKDGL